MKKHLLAFATHIWRHRLVRGVLRRLIPLPAREFYHAFRAGYVSFNKTQALFYAGIIDLRRDASQPATASPQAQELPRASASLIVVLPEENARLVNGAACGQPEGLRTWLEALSQQSLLPGEVIFANRGLSSDALAVISGFAQTAQFPVKVLAADGKGFPEAINLAIQNAAYPLIASTSCAYLPGTNWLESLLHPLKIDPEVQLSAGAIQAQARNNFQRLCAAILIPPLYPPNFVPSWQSLAIRKALWLRADGFPEWAGTASGEIIFGLQARQSFGKWAILPGASVSVPMPDSLKDFTRACYREGLAEGNPGFWAGRYWIQTLKFGMSAGLAGITLLACIASLAFLGHWDWLIPVGLTLVGAGSLLHALASQAKAYKVGLRLAPASLFLKGIGGFARWRGFIAGVRNRPAAQAQRISRYQGQLQQILDQHPHRKGIILYPPTHDWGYMFQLPQQMARQFARNGYLYFYATINEKTDDVTGFRQVEPNLYLCHVPFETFHILEHDPGARSASVETLEPKTDRLLLYIGSPWNRKYLFYFTNPFLIYDHYDDLAVSSGRSEDHLFLLHKADVVLVTSQRLLDNVKALRPDTLFAPNGVDYEHFQSLRPASGELAPADLQSILAKGRPIIGYTGALSDRFDYDLFLHLAQSRPGYEFVLIGADVEDSLKRSGLLKMGQANVHWLGIKSHDALAKYIWRFHVGIVPFKMNEITLATTSIKVFEYMACKVPVVSVAMPESKRYAGVFIAESYEKFAELVDVALSKKTDLDYLALIDQVARSNTWERRAQTLITSNLTKL